MRDNLIQKVIFHVRFDNERDWRLIGSAHTPAAADLIVLFPNPLEQVLTPKRSLTQRPESNSICSSRPNFSSPYVMGIPRRTRKKADPKGCESVRDIGRTLPKARARCGAYWGCKRAGVDQHDQVTAPSRSHLDQPSTVSSVNRAAVSCGPVTLAPATYRSYNLSHGA